MRFLIELSHMKLIEILLTLIIFSVLALGVVSQINAEARVYVHIIETLNRLEAEAEILRN